MKRLLIVLLVVLSTGVYSQAILSPVWSKVRNSPLTSGQTEGWGVDVDAKGHVYWPVSFDSANTNQQYDIVTYKYDSTGKQIWKSYYGGIGTQDAFICKAGDTALYVGGVENTVLPYFKSANHMLIIKIDTANGNVLKHNNINFGDAGGYDEMDGIVPEQEGIYCGGWAQYNGGIGDYGMGFLRLDYNLNVLNKKYFGDTTKTQAAHQDGHIIVDSNYIYGAGMWDGHSLFNNTGDGRAILGKFNRDSLTYVDTVLFGPSLAAAGDIQNALGSASDGKYIYVTGYCEPTTISDLQLFIAKFDKNLKQQWIHFFGGSGGEEARSILVNKGLIYVGGASNTSTYAPAGGYDALLLVYDTAGNFINYSTYGDAKDNEFRDMAVSGHYLYLAGSSGTKLFSGGTSDSAFLIKVDINTILTGLNNVILSSGIIVYPNPASDKLIIKTDDFNSNDAEVTISDITGRVVAEEVGTVKGSVVINVESLSPGTYVVMLHSKSKVAVTKFIKQ